MYDTAIKIGLQIIKVSIEILDLYCEKVTEILAFLTLLLERKKKRTIPFDSYKPQIIGFS